MLVLADCLVDNAGCAIYCSACFFCDKGCSDGGWDEINSDEACFVCLLGSVMSVWCEDSLISHKGWYRESGWKWM